MYNETLSDTLRDCQEITGKTPVRETNTYDMKQLQIPETA